MSVFTYGVVRGQIQKTEHYGFTPLYTEDGADYLYTEIDLAVTFVCNPFALATSGPGKIASVGAAPPFQEDAPAQANGDSLGVTLRNLRALLLTPRQTLSFSINNDQVVTITGPDSKNGPQPQRDIDVRWIMGTRTALVHFHVKAWTVDLLPSIPNTLVTPARRVVLANRYRVMSTTDDDWYARRYVAGQMIVDIAQLQTLAIDGVLTPDNFRAAAFLSIPPAFKRENIQVVVSSDNTTIDYSYVDQETPLTLGARSLATRIEGSVAAAISSPLKELSGVTGTGIAAGANLIGHANHVTGGSLMAPVYALGELAGSLPFVGGRLRSFFGNAAADPGGAAANLAATVATGALPKISGTGLVRIWGQRAASKYDLAVLGVNILIDRFATGFFNAFGSNQSPRAGGISIHQDLKERYVEVSMVFLPTLMAGFNATTGMLATSLNLMNMGADIGVIGQAGQLNGNQQGFPFTGPAFAGPILSGSLTGQNPAPPLSAGTRGDWPGALVVSLLGNPGEIPVNAPADPAVNIDVPFL